MFNFLKMLSLITLITSFLAACPVLAAPSYVYDPSAQEVTRALPPNLKLRIMPLGDSITYGIGSTDRASYRAALYNKLTAAGANVDYIGSQKAGNFAKPENEGWSGYTITQISSMSDRSIKKKPNVICLMAGTNDIAWAGNKQTAPNRLGELIDKLTAGAPDAVILVATLTPLRGKGGAGGSSDVDAFNSQVPVVVKARADKGKKVAVVSMAAVKVTDLKDGVHPNDAGYLKMADAWFKGIEEVATKGWIKEPAPLK